MLGETMDMPLPPELVQKAVKAGVIKSASQVTGPLPSSDQTLNLGTPAVESGYSTQAGSATYAAETGIGIAGPVSADAVNSQALGTEVKLSGTLTLVLQDSAAKYLNLVLQQNGNGITGNGSLSVGGGSQDVVASGSVEGSIVDLTVRPARGSDIYSLNLLVEGDTLKGSYTLQSASGQSTSGTAAGVMKSAVAGTSGPDKQANGSPPADAGLTAGGAGASSAVPSRAGPVQLGQPGSRGSSFSSSKSISMSASGGGSMVSSTSSTSF